MARGVKCVALRVIGDALVGAGFVVRSFSNVLGNVGGREALGVYVDGRDEVAMGVSIDGGVVVVYGQSTMDVVPLSDPDAIGRIIGLCEGLHDYSVPLTVAPWALVNGDDC